MVRLKHQPRMASGEHIHNDGQVDEVIVQPDVGDITDPNLVRMSDFQLFDQVGIAQIGVLAVGGTHFSAFDRSQQAHFAHQTLDPLAIHR